MYVCAPIPQDRRPETIVHILIKLLSHSRTLIHDPARYHFISPVPKCCNTKFNSERRRVLTASFTALLCTRGEFLLESWAAALLEKNSSSFFPDTALAKATTSCNFWAANAIHDFSSASNFVSFFRSTAECNNEHEVETTTFSAPNLFCKSSMMATEAAKSLAQMFLPSTTPANKVFPAGMPCSLINSRVLAPRTRSTPKAATDSRPMRVLPRSIRMSKNHSILNEH